MSLQVFHLVVGMEHNRLVPWPLLIQGLRLNRIIGANATDRADTNEVEGLTGSVPPLLDGCIIIG